MRKRLKSAIVAVAALAALALGGSALATAASSTSATEKVSATDPGPAVQQGDQTTPDVAAAKSKAAESQPANDPAGANNTTSPDTGSAGSAASDPAGANNTTSPDTGSAATENASENAPSDGPGGFADTNASADTQQQGEH